MLKRLGNTFSFFGGHLGGHFGFENMFIDTFETANTLIIHTISICMIGGILNNYLEDV